MTAESPRIRPYQPGDHDDVYRVCLLTADEGRDATPILRDPLLPGHVWAGPYITLEPSLAFVAEDAEGVAGYVLGALDTRDFEQRAERDWWPPLRAAYPPEPQAVTDSLAPLEQVALQGIQHSWVTPDELVTPFPSHLHIDMLPRLQGQGTGRRLMATLIAALRERGSRGLQLGVARGNERAAGFYEHLGFTEIPSEHIRTFTLDLTQPGR
jgi:ribosomal protein S18 acetylase RimI-like enzyme